MKRFLYLIFPLFALASCSSDTECRQDMNVYLQVVFQGDSIKYNAENQPEHVTYSTIPDLSIWGVGRDSLLADHASVSNARLPLKKDADECAFVFQHKGQNDTIFVTYERSETFESLACGCAVFSTIDKLLHTTYFIDSIYITNTAVNTARQNHLKIFLHNPN